MDQDELIRLGLAELSSPDVIVAVPGALSDHLIDLVQKGKIAGLVAIANPLLETKTLNGDRIGCWTSPECVDWRLPAVRGCAIVFLGPAQRLGARALMAAARQGTRHILTLARSGNHFERHLVAQLLGARLRAAGGRRMRSFEEGFRRAVGWRAEGARRAANGGDPVVTVEGTLDYAGAYALLRQRTWHLRLPAEAFDQARITLVAGTLGPGGAERQLTNTACGLKAHDGADVTVTLFNCQPGNDFYKPTLERAGVRVGEVALLSAEFDDPTIQAILEELRRRGPAGFDQLAHQVLAFVFLFRRERPGLVHSWMDAANAIVGPAAQVAGVPALVLGCRSMAPDHFGIYQPYMYPAYRGILASGPVQLINNSAAGAKDYGRWLGIPAERSNVLPNGFDFPAVPPEDSATSALRHQLAIPQDARVIGSIIRFSEEKRPFLMLDAIIEAVRADPTVYGVIFGGGTLLEKVREAVSRAGLETRIALPGTTSDAWLALSIMDLFILTSRMEGLPNVLVEAQAAGVPVVATAVGGAPETYLEGETGWGVAGNASASDIAAVCRRLLHDPELLASASVKAHTFARERFTRGRMVDDTLIIYERARSEHWPEPPNIATESELATPKTTTEAPRFGFGKNWSRFIKGSFSQERVDLARKHILEFMGRTDLKGLEMLDIGCGSGLHSLAAHQSGAARIHSLDYDPDSVATTRKLRDFAGNPAAWHVERGDALDDDYMTKLGTWNFVYSWGVLHHTGQVWKAIDNAQARVAEGGQFYIALYSADVQSEAEQKFWLEKKQEYNRSTPMERQKMAAWYIWIYMMQKKWYNAPAVAKRMIKHRFTRGMSLMTDIHDWLGGWPMEYTHDQEVVDMIEGKGFKLTNIRSGEACTEFLFERTGTPATRTNAKEFEAARKKAVA